MAAGLNVHDHRCCDRPRSLRLTKTVGLISWPLAVQARCLPGL